MKSSMIVSALLTYSVISVSWDPWQTDAKLGIWTPFWDMSDSKPKFLIFSSGMIGLACGLNVAEMVPACPFFADGALALEMLMICAFAFVGVRAAAHVAKPCSFPVMFSCS